MRRFFFILLALLCCAQPAFAKDLDYRAFGMIKMLHEGRLKPLDSYARLELHSLSGRDTIDGIPAIEWLAANIFDPVSAGKQHVIAVPAYWREQLNLPRDRKLFSLEELTYALRNYSDLGEELENANDDQLTREQIELRDLYHKVMTYSELQRSFTAFLPLNVDMPEALKLKGKTDYSYADFITTAQDVRNQVLELSRKKGTDLSTYYDEEKKLVALGFALEEVQATGADNDDLKIVKQGEQWLSPWQFLLQQKSGADVWQRMADAYRNGNAEDWKTATKEARGKAPFRLRLEKAYNVTEPFHSAMGFYLLGIIILAAEIHRKSRRSLFPLICLAAGLLSHAAGLLSRVIILQRPPVGTLYESLLFVSLICAASCAVLFYRRRGFAALFAGMGSAAFLLFLAPYMLREGDGLEPLVAVLNTNFWLGTHVLCITSGYGVCIVTAVLAHIFLWLRGKGAPIDRLMMLQTTVYRLSLAALLLTAVGTILGGIWADQSWGRFWGWDPKENGALLIVLWLIWMQHGRVAGKLDTNLFTVAAASLNIIVALAWFGVNLLSIGLHSYGFISGIAAALGAFCALEIGLITWLYIAAKRKKNALA